MSESTEKKKKSAVEKTLRWEAADFQYIPKDHNWYWIVWIIAIGLATVAFLASNWTFGVLLVVATSLLTAVAGQPPRISTITLNSKHLTINGKRYNMKNYESYRIDLERSKLLLMPDKQYLPITAVPIPDDHPTEKIETLLEDKLDLQENEELSEPTLEIMMHRLGF